MQYNVCIYNHVPKYVRQHTKNRIIMMIFPMYPTYLFMKCVSLLMNEVYDTATKEPTIDMLLKKIWEKYGANVLTLC